MPCEPPEWYVHALVSYGGCSHTTSKCDITPGSMTKCRLFWSKITHMLAFCIPSFCLHQCLGPMTHKTMEGIKNTWQILLTHAHWPPLPSVPTAHPRSAAADFGSGLASTRCSPIKRGCVLPFGVHAVDLTDRPAEFGLDVTISCFCLCQRYDACPFGRGVKNSHQALIVRA